MSEKCKHENSVYVESGRLNAGFEGVYCRRCRCGFDEQELVDALVFYANEVPDSLTWGEPFSNLNARARKALGEEGE